MNSWVASMPNAQGRIQTQAHRNIARHTTHCTTGTSMLILPFLTRVPGDAQRGRGVPSGARKNEPFVTLALVCVFVCVCVSVLAL